MKIVTVDAARTIWLFDTGELNPNGRSIEQPLAELAVRYNFKKFPKHSLDRNEQQGLAFEQGEFTNSKGVKIGVTVTLYSDGIVAETRSSTQDTTDFLKDVTAWLKSVHNLSLPDPARVKVRYLSLMTVTTDRKMISLNPKLTAFANHLSAVLKETTGEVSGFNLGAIGFWSNDAEKPLAPPHFRLENKGGVSVEEKKYFTQAPFQTDKHLELLNELENILA